MPIYRGNTELSALKLGAGDVQAVYVGADQVWPSGRTYDEIIADNSPWAYYKLQDTGSPSTILDSSGNGRNMVRTSNGSQSPVGGQTPINALGNSMNFPPQSKIYYNPREAPPSQTAISMVAWINTADLNAGTDGADHNIVATEINTSGIVATRLRFNLLSGARAFQAYGMGRVMTGGTFLGSQNLMLAVTASEPDNVSITYVNGVEVARTTSNSPSNTWTAVSVGGGLTNIAWSDSRNIRGRISHVSIHSAVISPEDILELYNAGKL
jgi:hypothetical protein